MEFKKFEVPDDVKKIIANNTKKKKRTIKPKKVYVKKNIFEKKIKDVAKKIRSIIKGI